MEQSTSSNGQEILLQGPAGTRDFYPQNMIKRNWLFGLWRDISKRYGFLEYDAPILEYANLYTRKGGDDILREMYSFVDREGTSVALRPEMTPSVARMVMAIYKGEISPIKWFSIPQCWRFETTTRGRKREHFQWNVDIFGAEKVKSEVEILSMIVKFFERVGLTENDVVIRISNRMILQTVLTKLNVDCNKIERTFTIIDKIKKISQEELFQMLESEIGLTRESCETIVRLMGTTNISQLGDFIDPTNETLGEMIKIFDLAETLEFSKWLQFDASIVRGLSYYTGMVFEGFFKNSTLQRSICGGGRYDNLLEKYGYSEKVPAVGFGFGDIVTLEVLAELGKLPDLKSTVDYCVVSYSEDLYSAAAKIADRLRNCNKTVTLYMKCDRKLRIAFSYADRIDSDFVILVAPNEFSENKMVLKNLRSTIEKEKTVGIDEYINSL